MTKSESSGRVFRGICFSCALSAALMAPANARDVPVTVRWYGDKPDSVTISDSRGDRPLVRNGSASAFAGVFSVSGGPVQLGAVTIQYRDYFHTFQVRLNPRISQVDIPINHHIQKSCTQQRVHSANAPASTKQEAAMRAVDAGELLSIQGHNACDKYLKFYAAQAKYAQTARLVKLSDGQYLMDRATEEQYRSAARERGIPVDAEIASNQTREGAEEVKRLVAGANRAKAAQDYRLALDIEDFMESRIESSPATAEFYRKLGITTNRLAADSDDLRDRLRTGGRNPYVMAGERGEK